MSSRKIYKLTERERVGEVNNASKIEAQHISEMLEENRQIDIEQPSPSWRRRL